LIELLIAASLFLAVVLAFGYLLRHGKMTVDSAVRLNQSIYAIQTKSEELHALPFDQLPALNGKTFARGQGKIKVISALADLVNIQLEFRWDPNKVPLKLQTLRSRY
jgi:hypothetical protein